MRNFDTGATRNDDTNKLDYEGFLSPAVLRRYAEYMHAHRKQADGKLRASDNWKKGISREAYKKSDIRHTIDLWRLDAGEHVVNPDNGEPCDVQELLCAKLFNTMGRLYEELKKVTTTCETCEEPCDFFAAAAEPRKVCDSCLSKGLRTYAELKRSGTVKGGYNGNK